ncbi:MAG TPA: NfeD family protein [Egibacteraceae bacterium]|nr:NfeD family protein [Egibacteraceae bacterium]
MTVFVIIGAVGLALVVVSLIFGDVLDGVLDFAHFDVTDGWLSTPVLGAFLAAFGFAGALLLRGLQVSLLGATAGGVAAGVLLSGLTLGMVRALMNMPTDPTPRTADLVGAIGTVVTRIPGDGLGEITVSAAGQRVKLAARSDKPIAYGTTVVVVEVTSPTSVIVTESGF